MPTDEAKEEQNSSVWHRLQRDPALAFWLGIISLAVGVGTWWFSRSTVEPVYRAFPVETVARKESPRLSVLWDNKPIPNLCVEKIAFWNEGTAPLGQDRLAQSDPLRIVADQRIHLLALEMAHTSRPTLTMTGTISPDEQAVYLAINGSDALEKNDGVAFRVLFSGDCSATHFSVRGRVIGTKGDVATAFDPNSPEAQYPSQIMFVSIVVIALFGLISTRYWPSLWSIRVAKVSGRRRVSHSHNNNETDGVQNAALVAIWTMIGFFVVQAYSLILRPLFLTADLPWLPR